MTRRRDESLHERLLREGGVEPPPESAVPVAPEGPLLPGARYPLPEWAQAAALLKQWGSEWDVLVSAEAPGIEGGEVEFVALEDGSLIVDLEEGDASLEPLADAVEAQLARPYRARGIRHEQGWWAVGARRTTICELPGVEADAVELTVYRGERTVSGVPAGTDLSVLDELASGRGLSDYAVEAERLDDRAWEVRLSPL